MADEAYKEGQEVERAEGAEQAPEVQGAEQAQDVARDPEAPAADAPAPKDHAEPTHGIPEKDPTDPDDTAFFPRLTSSYDGVDENSAAEGVSSFLDKRPKGDQEGEDDEEYGDIDAILPFISAHKAAAHSERVKLRKQRESYEKKISNKLALIVVCVLGAAALISLIYATYRAELWGGKTVPDLVGASQDSAIYQLNKVGLKAEVKTREADDGIGIVLECDPGSGARIGEGSTVLLTVGAPRVIPKVVGMSTVEAQNTLEKAGAKDIEVIYQESEAEPDSVLSVDPAEGSDFTVRDKIKLVVAQPHTVPDVVGQTEAKATKQLQDAGFVVKTAFVASDEKDNTVVSTSPKTGSEVELGAEITINIASPYPTDVHHLAEYFAHKPTNIAAYLQQESFNLQGAYTDDKGNLQAFYAGPSGAKLALSSRPFSHVTNTGQSKGKDELAEGASFEGVRYQFGYGELPPNADRVTVDGAYNAAVACGFTGTKEMCTRDTVIIPEGAWRTQRQFVCLYGEMGDYCWTILLAEQNYSKPRLIATYAPKSLYQSLDLSGTNNSVCHYVAYTDMMTEWS